MAKISLILPSYNVGKYIRQCMESVVGQTHSDLEILCIDAGSTDGTHEILDEYSNKDARVRVILSEKKSYGHQVNIGIAEADGQYVGIVETDDYIEPDMCQRLCELMEEEAVDFAKGTALYCYDLASGQTYQVPRTGMFSTLFSEKDEVVTLESGHFPGMLWKDYHLWNGLYTAELIKQIHLNETPGAAYQDTGFLYQLYTKAKKGRYVNHPVYHYRKTNKDASAYDTRALSNLRYEYGEILQPENKTEEKWRCALAMKAFFQVRRKLYLMGYQGRYWTEAEQDIQELRSLVIGNTSIGAYPENYREDAELFFQDTGSLFEKFRQTLSEKKTNLLQMQAFVSGRQFALIGVTSAGKFALTFLMSKGLLPVAVCDNAEKKIGTKWERGFIIASPEEVLGERPATAFIITVVKKESAEAIENQLTGLGVHRDDIMIYRGGSNEIFLLDDHE